MKGCVRCLPPSRLPAGKEPQRAAAMLSASRTSEATGTKGGVLGQQGEIRHGKLFGWRQRDFASSQMMLESSFGAVWC